MKIILKSLEDKLQAIPLSQPTAIISLRLFALENSEITRFRSISILIISCAISLFSRMMSYPQRNNSISLDTL